MYIKDLSCISPQQTYSQAFLQGRIEHFKTNHYLAAEPSYEELIPSSKLRRMGKVMRMGIGTGLPLLNKYPETKGIILATSEGGVEDSMNFLNQVVKYQEGALTPTNFVQSTPNAIAGLLALMTKNTGYNVTHVNKGLAFESALTDASLFLEEEPGARLLLGGLDQFSVYNYNIELLAGAYKKHFVDSSQLLGSGSPGTVCGEGSAMFIVDSQKKGALAQIKGVGQGSGLSLAELMERLRALLTSSNLVPEDIDAVVLGYNGDSETDTWYDKVRQELFPHQAVYSFKNLVGEYSTVSAFALWFATQLLSGFMPPKEAVLKASGEKPKRILIYNHHRAVQHGYMLLTV